MQFFWYIFVTSLYLSYSGLFGIWVNSPLNPTGRQRDQYIPDRCRVDTSHTAHSRPGTRATYSAQTAYREYPFERDLPWRRWTRFLLSYRTLLTLKKRGQTEMLIQQTLLPSSAGMPQSLLFLQMYRGWGRRWRGRGRWSWRRTRRDGGYV